MIVDGVWALTFGNGVSLGDANALYFSSGPSKEFDGVFGRLNLATPSLSVSRSGFSVNVGANKVFQTVTIKNESSSTVEGPIGMSVDNLSSNTILTNSAGLTTNSIPVGIPYVTVSSSGLTPGASANVVLQFTLPTHGGITYHIHTVAGGTAP